MKTLIAAGMAGLFMLVAPIWAAAPDKAPQAGSGSDGASAVEAAVSPEAITQMIRQLDADKFEARQRAQESLALAARAPEQTEVVVAALVAAGDRASLEAATRIIAIF